MGLINNTITIIRPALNDPCDKSILPEDSELIIGLKRADHYYVNSHSTLFEIQQINPTQSTAFEVSENLLRYMTHICGLSDIRFFKSVSSPSHACPIIPSKPGRSTCVSSAIRLHYSCCIVILFVFSHLIQIELSK